MMEAHLAASADAPVALPPETGAWASDAALTRAEWQPILFAERPTRGALLGLRPAWPLRRVTVRVHRNLACEFVTSAATPYLAFAGFEAEWRFGDYDDSLSFPVAGDADVELIWLDHGRFDFRSVAALAEWLDERIRALRQRSRSPILVNTDVRGTEAASAVNAMLDRASATVPGLHPCDLSDVAAAVGATFFDARNAALSGLPYSNGASILIARQLGSRWLPGVLRSRLKAIVLDLDHTLYAGVLGEDGIDGVALTDGHRALQQALVGYHAQGIFLAICSKNEPEDVEALFAARTDFPLRPEHFSARAIGWSSKSGGIAQIAKQLRIGTDAMLYVDDNPGELASIAGALPDLNMLHAGADTALTLRALRDYPGLHRWREDDTDRLRVADLAAAAERERQASNVQDAGAYLRSLRLHVDFRVDHQADADRLQSLSIKTNQFNLAMRRFAATDVAAYLSGSGAHAVAVQLADRLSDSGNVGAVFLRLDGDVCHVDEVCISCRALGRGLDDLLVLGTVRAAVGDGAAPSVLRFAHDSGPRNAPARHWLERLLGVPLEAPAGHVDVPWSRCEARLADVDALLGDSAATTS